ETQTVTANILIAMKHGRLGWLLSSVSRAADIATAHALLTFVGYRGDPEALAGSLAHIDRRLVEIARALALRPKVLLLDEPAAGLTYTAKMALQSLIARIARLGIAVILVEHDMPLVMQISDHFVVLEAGRLLAQGQPSEIRANPEVIRAYLGEKL